VRVIGFAKIIGSLLDGILKVMMYFGAAILIAAAILFYFTRCVRSTFVVLLCSLIAVIWQIGLLRLLGSARPVLGSGAVPDLRDRVSHGAQKMNGIQQTSAAARAPSSRALHVPPAVRRGRDGAAERRRVRCAAADPIRRFASWRSRRPSACACCCSQPRAAARDPVDYRREQDAAERS